MKRKLVTKIISVAMASCMMAGMLTGCGSSGDTAGAGSTTSGGAKPLLTTVRRMQHQTMRQQTARIQEAQMLLESL